VLLGKLFGNEWVIPAVFPETTQLGQLVAAGSVGKALGLVVTINQ
jgi:hypothetical protein